MNIKTVTAILILLAAANLPLHAQDRTKNSGSQTGSGQPQTPVASTPSHSPIQGMTTSPIQGMTASPIQGMTSSPVTGMGVGVPLQKSSTPVQRPQGRKTGTSIFVLSPADEMNFVPDETMAVGSNPNQELGTSLTTPGLPTVSLNPEISAEPPAPRGSSDGGMAIETSSLHTNANVTRLEPGTPQAKVIEKYGNPIRYSMNKDGQTLYFKGGAVVFIKDGVVATPGK